jgi:hypothetical protein
MHLRPSLASKTIVQLPSCSLKVTFCSLKVPFRLGKVTFKDNVKRGLDSKKLGCPALVKQSQYLVHKIIADNPPCVRAAVLRGK